MRKSQLRLPHKPQTPVIMIGPGTGLAPFRGFIQDRHHQKKNGMSVLNSDLLVISHEPIDFRERRWTNDFVLRLSPSTRGLHLQGRVGRLVGRWYIDRAPRGVQSRPAEQGLRPEPVEGEQEVHLAYAAARSPYLRLRVSIAVTFKGRVGFLHLGWLDAGCSSLSLFLVMHETWLETCKKRSLRWRLKKVR